MGRKRKQFQDDWNDNVFANSDVDIDGLIDTMEAQDHKPRSRVEFEDRRSGRQRLEDWKEERLLKRQLSDWDDWDEKDDLS